MSYPVIIFSADDLRGGITKQILQQNNIKALWVSRILEARDTIVKHTPVVTIFDTKNALPDEIAFLKNFYRTFKECFVLILGNTSLMEKFEGSGLDKNVRLADPFDPELIVSTVKEILQSKTKAKGVKRNILENDLKQFLKLE